MGSHPNRERTERDTTRRGLLGAGGAAGASVVAGCGADGTSDSTPSERSGQAGTGSSPTTDQDRQKQWESVEARRVNGVYYAEPGELQATIDDAAEDDGHGGVVELQPGATYELGEEIHLKPAITLDFNGATLEIADDHNGIFVDAGAKVLDGDIRVLADTYASDVVVLDTGRTTIPWWDDMSVPENMRGKYAMSTESPVTVETEIYGAFDEGVGLALRDTKGPGISIGNRFDVRIKRTGVGILAAGGGWVNSVDLTAGLTACKRAIKQTEDTRFATEVHGFIQPVENPVFLNETRRDGMSFHGHLWDLHHVNEGEEPVVKGPKITLVLTHTGDTRTDAHFTSDGAPNQRVYNWEHSGLRMYDLSNDHVWEWLPDENGLTLAVDGTPLTSWSPNGTLQLASPQDLAETEVEFFSSVGLEDGSNTSSGQRELAVSQPDGSWLTMLSGDRIEPAGGTGYEVPNRSITIDGDPTFDGLNTLDLEQDFRIFDGEPTIPGKVAFAWDAEYLYLVADFGDDSHVQTRPETSLWKEDVIQLGVTSGQPGAADEWDQFDIALAEDGPTVFRRVLPSKDVATALDTPSEIVRTDGNDPRTRYEVAIPWSDLTASPDDAAIGLSVAIHDVDEDGEGYLEWASGIFGGKDNTQFELAVLQN